MAKNEAKETEGESPDLALYKVALSQKSSGLTCIVMRGCTALPVHRGIIPALKQ